jgi:anti-sigma regulatory factor (Ser/Thr protein kinase)
MLAAELNAEIQAGTLKFSIPASTEYLERLRGDVREFLALSGVPEKAAHDIVVGVDEAVSNAVVHACRKDPEHEVSVDVRVGRSEVQVTVTNPGPRFDPSSFPEPDRAAAMKAGRRPPLGIHMMRKVFDDMICLCVHEGVNHLVLTKSLSPAPPACRLRILPA